jgi:hypothetical protein
MASRSLLGEKQGRRDLTIEKGSLSMEFIQPTLLVPHKPGIFRIFSKFALLRLIVQYQLS